MNTRKIILVAGYCATGKSTFARGLSEALGIPCFCKDTLKEAIADGFGADSEAPRKMGSAAAHRVMLHIAECFLLTGRPCILEANFRLSQAKEIAELAEKHGAECMTFLFHGDLGVLWKRYARRESERHWVHKTAGEDRDGFVEGHIKAGIGEAAVGRTVRIDATDFSKIDYAALHDLAARFIENSL